MIESIHIENLRGIRRGALEGLTRLTVLLGPNSSGKSTILDALLIASSLSPGDAVGRAVQRRTRRDADASWLLWRRGAEGSAVLRVKATQGAARECLLSWQAEARSDLVAKLQERAAEPPLSCIELRCSHGSETALARTAFSIDNLYVYAQEPERLPDALKLEPEVRFIDMRGIGLRTSLPSLYTEVLAQGRRREAYELLQEIVPGLESMEILGNPRNEPVLHMVFPDRSVPVALAGDGIRSALRLSLELASRSRGLVLIEEPELHQHPRALQQSAKALMASMRRGVQIVLSTHSLELIDSLLLEAAPEDLQHLSAYRLDLSDGVLVSSRLGGEQLALARGQLEEGL